jgi:hypothetical protein
MNYGLLSTRNGAVAVCHARDDRSAQIGDAFYSIYSLHYLVVLAMVNVAVRVGLSD